MTTTAEQLAQLDEVIVDEALVAAREGYAALVAASEAQHAQDDLTAAHVEHVVHDAVVAYYESRRVVLADQDRPLIWFGR